MDKLLLGIDFGTSTNFITKYDFLKKDAVAVENMGEYGGSNIFDNVIYIESGTNVVLGAAANKKGLSDPMNYFSDIKRYVVSEQWKQKIPHRDNRIFSAKDIATLIFTEIKAKVEKSENRSVDGIVLTVPYSYGDTYRRNIKEAVEASGMRVLKIIEEPIAAAVSFGILDNASEAGKKKILVFDFGGGTLDITIFQFSKKNQHCVQIEVLNTDGVERLGGKDIDHIIISKFQHYLSTQYDDISNEIERKEYQENLTKLAMETKENLSEDDEDDIYENYTINGDHKELELELSRDEFNGWLKNNNIIGEIEDALDRTLMGVEEEDLEAEDIDRIILAGGSSSIPIIYQTIKNYFGKEPESRKNLGELVAHGAGIIAGLTVDDSLEYEIIRRVSKNIGIAKGNRFKTILPKNTSYGIESVIHHLTIKNKETLKINFYEGDSAIIEHCEEIGSITIDTSILQGEKIGITLSKDKDEGRIIYHLYNQKNKIIETNYI